MFKKTLLGAVLAAGSVMSLVPTAANAQYTAIVSVAPPTPVYEVAPEPRRGYVWVPGHHQWRGNQYVWVHGNWIQARSGYVYHEPRWVQRGDQWQLVGGNWERGPYGDRDRDGIANRDDPDSARNQRYVVVSVAPPAPVYEVAPEPRRGYVWVPGHHQWRGNQYVWVQGNWIQARSGYVYREPRWVQRGDQWQLVGGNWERGPYGDRDQDGIINRDDPDSPRNQRHARRFGPYGDLDRDGIINRDDRDRDGDGVRNRLDRYPDDRSRS